MPAETKKLGEMLVDAGLIDQGQLQSALRHQRIAGGRMGSNLVAMGMISEDALMDFLAAKTGVPRLDVKSLKVPPEVLRRIPRRLAEQFTLLPVAFKEPRSLVVAMADPSDLNAVDGARFASGLTIEPMVASHSALKHAIADLYTELQTGVPSALEVSGPVKPVEPAPARMGLPTAPAVPFRPDPFLAEPIPVALPARDLPNPFDPGFSSQSLQPQIIHARSATFEGVRRLEDTGTRALALGLVRLLKRRGILGDDELERFLTNLIAAGEVDPNQ